jgi:hypothetical protein
MLKRRCEFWKHRFRVSSKQTDRSVAVAAILTRSSAGYSACPLFDSAFASRSGSLLAEAAAIIAMGKPAPATA